MYRNITDMKDRSQEIIKLLKLLIPAVYNYKNDFNLNIFYETDLLNCKIENTVSYGFKSVRCYMIYTIKGVTFIDSSIFSWITEDFKNEYEFRENIIKIIDFINKYKQNHDEIILKLQTTLIELI